MAIPWGELGLGLFRAVSGQREAVFHEGAVVHRVDSESEPLPIVVYGEDLREAACPVFDAKAMARVLHPTLADHELATVGATHSIRSSDGDMAKLVGDVFVALVAEAACLDREVVGLLARLEPEPLATLFGRAMRIAPATARPPSDEEPSEEPPSASEASGVEDPLGSGGFVARGLPSYERREGQAEMARAVRGTLAKGGALVVEAGPGTGKTFAYLIPAIETLLEDESSRVVVSTRTKQLQEQLYEKDLPFLLRHMAPGLKVALLKGRGNYLCLRRWGVVVQELSEGLERDRLQLLGPLARWLWETETGDIDENTAFLSDPGGRELWHRLCDSPQHCVDSFCTHYEDCFSIAARRRARRARLVVANHSLLLNDLIVDRMILGKYAHAIIDEAHSLEETARSVFTWSLSSRLVDRIADELTPSRRRRLGWLGRLGLPREGDRLARATDGVATLRATTARLFSVLAKTLPSGGRGGLPNLDPQTTSALDRFRMAAGGVEESLLDLIEDVDELDLRREGEVHAASLRELGGLAARLSGDPEEDAVRWYEREPTGVSLHVTPLDVAPILHRFLYPELDAVVLTSATLSVGERFEYVLRTVGLEGAFDALETKTVASPFSYDEHMRVCVPAKLPLLTEDPDGYVDELVDLLAALSGRLDRKGLVLFTSYEMLEAVRERLPRRIPALAQGADGPRSKILERFRRHAQGVLLLGTDSFWEGVDLPGDELEYLVITRLPFAVPTDPIQAALGRLIGRSGRDPFRDLSLPRAVLRLRQGVGRLIRTQRDRGAVILADRRILAKGYGRTFADALPSRLEIFDSSERLVDALGRWFDEGAETSSRPM